MLLLFWKNLMKAWKREAFEQNYFRKKLLHCISQNSLKITFDEVLSYLGHSQPGTLLKKTPSQVFFYDFYQVFQNSYSIERW